MSWNKLILFLKNHKMPDREEVGKESRMKAATKMRVFAADLLLKLS